VSVWPPKPTKTDFARLGDFGTWPPTPSRLFPRKYCSNVATSRLFDVIATLAEKLQADRFKQWRFESTGKIYLINDGPNPPDFHFDLPNRKSWLEVTDVFENDEEAKFRNSKILRYSFKGLPDQIARRFIKGLQKKLTNPNYRPAYEERGKGTLLLTSESVAFDVVNLARVEEAIATFQPTADLGFFATAYCEYELEGRRYYRLVYGRDEAM
jgi:hypothetical protein